MEKIVAEKICDGRFTEECAKKHTTYGTVCTNATVDNIADKILAEMAECLDKMSELFAQYRALKGGGVS